MNINMIKSIYDIATITRAKIKQMRNTHAQTEQVTCTKMKTRKSARKITEPIHNTSTTADKNASYKPRTTALKKRVATMGEKVRNGYLLIATEAMVVNSRTIDNYTHQEVQRAKMAKKSDVDFIERIENMLSVKRILITDPRHDCM